MNSVAQTAVPTQHVVDTAGLSHEAVDYLRRTVRTLRRCGEGAAWANAWADGYRAWHSGTTGTELASRAGWDGWEYAKGEDAYWHCLATDGAAEVA